MVTPIALFLNCVLCIITVATAQNVDNSFFEDMKWSLMEKPPTFNATQSRKYNDQLCVTQFLETLNGIGHYQRWAIDSIQLFTWI